jgi:hypothetical protein
MLEISSLPQDDSSTTRKGKLFLLKEAPKHLVAIALDTMAEVHITPGTYVRTIVEFDKTEFEAWAKSVVEHLGGKHGNNTST